MTVVGGRCVWIAVNVDHANTRGPWRGPAFARSALDSVVRYERRATPALLRATINVFNEGADDDDKLDDCE